MTHRPPMLASRPPTPSPPTPSAPRTADRAARPTGARAIIARDEAVTSPSLTTGVPARACAAARAACSRTSTATASSTSTPASPSSPPATPTRTSTPRSTPRSTTSCTTARATSSCPPTPTSASAWPPWRRCPTARVFLVQLRHRGRRGRPQAGPPPHRRPNAIAFFGAFHGRSLGSLSLTASKARQRAGFGIVTPGSVPRPVRRSPRPRRPHRGRVHRAGAVHDAAPTRATSPRSSSSRSRARAATSSRPPGGWPTSGGCAIEHGILLVIDEVQSGVGRTGTMWACRGTRASSPTSCASARAWPAGCRWPGSSPRAEIMDWAPGGHGSTFGGNPVACAAARRHARSRRAGELAANAADVGGHLLVGAAGSAAPTSR